MIHMCAFGFTASNTGAGVYVTVPAKQDAFLTVNANNRFILPPPFTPGAGNWRIAAAYAGSTNITVARINNATLRAVGLPSIVPVNPALAIPSALNLARFDTHGPQLPAADEFGIEADETAAVVQTGFLWLSDGVMQVQPGQRYTFQFASTITTVANAWTAGTLTFTQSLPVGKYAVIGLDVLGTTCMGARLVFPNGGPRPGCLGRATVAILPQNQFRCGNFGTFGEFTSYAQPQLEVFASSAAAITFTGQMDVIKVA